jgi:hypothetical protein
MSVLVLACKCSHGLLKAITICAFLSYELRNMIVRSIKFMFVKSLQSTSNSVPRSSKKKNTSHPILKYFWTNLDPDLNILGA